MSAIGNLEREALGRLRALVRMAPPAAGVVDGCATVAEAVTQLRANGYAQPASALMAHALPHREAVWWACMCADHTAPAKMPEPDAQARAHAEAWVRTQGEGARFAAMDAAERAGLRTPEALAAVAAYFSGPSLAPAPAERLPPAARAAGDAVAGAVALAAAREAPARFKQRLELFLDSGWDISAGGAGRIAAAA